MLCGGRAVQKEMKDARQDSEEYREQVWSV
jgi:hypothetical protein